MKRLLIGAAAAALLLPAQTAMAHDDGHDHACIDEACTVFELFQTAPVAGGTSGWQGVEAPKYGTWGFDLSSRDTSVRPGDNFFRYANGAALDRLEIPSDRTSYGSFALLRELSDNRLKAMVDTLSARSDLAAGSDEQKIADAYRSYMDEARVEQLDRAPIDPYLADIRALDTHAKLAAYMGRTDRTRGSLFGMGISADQKSPDAYVSYISQSGLGLPNRDYYLDARFERQRGLYRAYLEQMLTLAGWANPSASADAVMAFETRIAEAHWSPEQSRDRDRTYNEFTPASLTETAPGFDWAGYMNAAGLGDVQRVVVRQNTAFPQMAAIFAETPVETLQAWQAFHTTDRAASRLSKRFADAQWGFRLRDLQGQPEQRARDKRGISFTEGMLGESMGRLYVAEYFPPESKAKMEELVANLRVALEARINQLPWMGDATKAQAQDKLKKFNVKIGYPSKWRDYSALDIRADDLFGNAERANAFEWNYNRGRMNGPVDRDEWGMTPQTVNAYYNSTMNEIVFPAAILQPPFFDPDADPAVNYGAIGGVIGHEIGHGFDDQGRKSDGDGVLRDWWTAEDAANFTKATDIMDAQFASYEPLPGYPIRPGLSRGENIGDLAGVTLGLEGYRASLNGQPSPVLDGTTGDQRVFYGWAQVWQTKYREEALRQQVTNGPHSPAEFRVIGPIRNVDAWYEAFDVQPGDKYYVAPEGRVRLW
ncbi:MAG: M13 family metallopeptidase [Brevundimonas sp.]|uniref:M13 family metallopeptidase n=1 Tax=Brevundimonas sp. TaxID=1871086 RepID=UPI003918BA5D